MQMFPYGLCALISLLVLLFLTCPVILFVLPIVGGASFATKAFSTEEGTCVNRVRLTNPLIYYAFLLPLMLIGVLLLMVLLAIIGAAIGVILAALLSVPVQLFVIYFVVKVSVINCRVIRVK